MQAVIRPRRWFTRTALATRAGSSRSVFQSGPSRPPPSTPPPSARSVRAGSPAPPRPGLLARARFGGCRRLRGRRGRGRGWSGRLRVAAAGLGECRGPGEGRAPPRCELTPGTPPLTGLKQSGQSRIGAFGSAGGALVTRAPTLTRASRRHCAIVRILSGWGPDSTGPDGGQGSPPEWISVRNGVVGARGWTPPP